MENQNLTACLAYLDKLPVAQSGAGGHNTTLKAALACRRFGLAESEMWTALSWFNDNRCNPKWTEKELKHKMASVIGLPINKPLGQRGYVSNRNRPFVAPAPIERQPDQRPICQRSAQEEELWWEQWCHGQGMTLAEFDRRCGNG